MYDTHRHLEARQSRRMAAESRFIDRLERREREAEALVGELNSGKFYVNKRDRAGRLTGKEEYFDRHYDAIAYLLRNNYV
ncbi:hypothetical protein EVB39_098 [Rhizobium phage RHph_TM3_3_9]|nr:hypothetical protein EVB39_098 [Rhizobium phage RHph_TM3_3_9]QIG68619.1 hypothetical protein EVB66_098 [Rhizobium phage RHph_TM3_3_13]QIG74477.1 hypothetical protein EVC09_097 [Rhizobium phage RHph_TM3_3_10]QXV74591.1 hypothetical protein [Rhizobium phage RHEph19]